MTVHVGEIMSEVVPDDARTPASAAAPSEDPERLREWQERMRRDALRTRAEGFDD
jgi:hypothetical protein